MKTDKNNAELAVQQPNGKVELRAEAMQARAELASTLDAIEYKLNVPKQLRIRRRRMRLALIRLGDDNPAALAGIALGAAASAGTLVWVVARAVLVNRR